MITYTIIPYECVQGLKVPIQIEVWIFKYREICKSSSFMLYALGNYEKANSGKYTVC